MAYQRMLGKRRRGGSYGSSKKRRSMGRRMKRRRSRSSRPYSKIMRQPVPDKMFTKLKYTEAISFGSLTGLTLSHYTFRNSIFDPDVTAVGHQPLWRDQLFLLYTRYRVHGIKYRFTIWNQNQPAGLIGAVKHSDDGITETSWTTLRERRSVRSFVVSGPGAKQSVVKGYMACGKPHGLTKKEFMFDEDFEADMNSNPVKQTYLQLYLTTQGPTAVANVVVDMLYYVELTGRSSVSGS
uniref:Putative capsid protein n=1 Tax=Phoenicopterus roseus CRESS-DNA-virus sp. TaxID=2815052 RepID=A0A8A4XBF9_9VIRU|nr:MAG: putative capsid protein [Phoenicopterus roseus CRESS-DNA-virus sp.]